MPDNQLVERLHSMLAHAMQGSRPQAFDSPVTVAEIYQDLVPYRNVRSALGFQMNADYEHTLLRMLAGEGGLARLEPAEARHELRTELDTPNPNVGLFRKFAACDVWVTPAAAEESPPTESAPDSPAPEAMPDSRNQPGLWGSANGDPTAVASDLDEWESALPELILDEVVPAEPEAESMPEAVQELPREPAPEPAHEPPQKPPPVETSPQPETTTMMETAATPAAGAIAQGADCAFCSSSLPTGRTVKFCPFCGVDQSMQPCVSCAEPLEPVWRFCITCGADQETGATG